MKRDLARPSREAEPTAPPGSLTSLRTASAALSGSASLVAVLVVALASRVLAGGVLEWLVRRMPNARLCVFPDTAYYWLLARAIRTWSAYDVVEWGSIHHMALRTPGYPLFLAACQAVFGESPLAVRLVQAVLGTASVWLVYRLTRQVDASSEPEPRAGAGSWTAPVLAAGLAAINPYYVAMSELLLSEALFIPLMLLMLWGLATLMRAGDEPVRAGGRRSWRLGLVALLTGAAGGAAVLTRPSFGLFPPAVLVAWVLRQHSWPRRGRRHCGMARLSTRSGRIRARHESVVDSQRAHLRPVRPHVRLAGGQASMMD